MNKTIQYFKENGWEIVETFSREGKEAKFVSADKVNLCANSQKLLDKNYPQGLYQHQYESINQFIAGNHVCLSTPTASGKTLAFQVCALEFLNQNPNGRVLAVFPSLALNANQKDRWDNDMKIAGYPENTVVKIDGGIKDMQERLKLLKNAKIVIMTPDVIHAWLLRKSDEPEVRKFLKNLGVLIVDEVHNYSGVFGSNSAYMYRRLKNLAMFLGGKFRIISASATLHNTEKHLSDLLGENFEIVGKDVDSSKQYPQNILMVNPPEKGGALTHCVPLIKHLVESSAGKFIAFIDNRQQAEQIPAFADIPSVKSFRAGYEAKDRKEILQQLTENELMGVVSTSALEVGIDIPDVTLGVLWGVPSSMTSYAQRSGRIGRNAPSNIIVINNRSPHSEHIFETPSRLNEMSLSESSLYLGNKRIQYMHTLCIAMRDVGEIDKAHTSLREVAEDIELQCEFPKKFEEIFALEKSGQISDGEMLNMKAEALDCPHLAFPLRYIESQYKVALVGTEDRIDSLSESQVLREAYPGAIYLRKGKFFRVVRLDKANRVVYVKTTRMGITKPKIRPPYISPLLTGQPSNILGYGDFSIVSANASIQTTAYGYKEGDVDYNYPNRYYGGQSISFFKTTSGVFIHVPDFDNMSSDSLSKTAALLFDAFVSVVPYDRQDIDFGTGKFKVGKGRICTNDKFIAIFDQNRGSLLLSARIMESKVIRLCADMAYNIALQNTGNYGDILPVMEKLRDGANQDLEAEINLGDENVIDVARRGSVVLNGEGKRIIVKKFVYDMNHNSLVYKGPEEGAENGAIYTITVNHAAFSDDTKMTRYDLDNNEWLDSTDE